MKALLLAVAVCLGGTTAAAEPDPQPAPPDAGAAKRRGRVANRVRRSVVASAIPGAGLRLPQLMDKRLGSTFGSQLEAARLRQIQTQKRREDFVGVIDSMTVGGMEISLERRPVRTSLGLKSLLLTRAGNEFVYDGDLIVPPIAIADIGFSLPEGGPTHVTFAAGPSGTFGEGALWDDGIIPFEVADDFCCKEELAEAIADYEERSIFRFPRRDGHQTYVRFVNSEPFLTSRTQLGKQRGQNDVKIQGFTLDGARAGNLVGGIQHEIGHELSLIHEHLRSDRDQFIARNPSCAPADIFQAIYEGWIDIGQTAFTDGSAELLTPYDFDSMMHYPFFMPGPNCNTWVRIDTCPDGDPTSPNCIADFESDRLSGRDIEGLHKLYSRVPVGDEQRTFSGDNIRHRGRRIDRCLHGMGLLEDGCAVGPRDRVADEFCKSQGFRDGFDVLTEGMVGEHSGLDRNVGWVNVWGLDVISSITCQNLTGDQGAVEAGTLDESTFTGDTVKVSGRWIDRCVHGDGIVGDRCGPANQQRVADAFCAREDFERASAFETDFGGPNPFMTGLFPSTGNFGDVSGLDRFTEVTCVRAP